MGRAFRAGLLRRAAPRFSKDNEQQVREVVFLQHLLTAHEHESSTTPTTRGGTFALGFRQAQRLVASLWVPGRNFDELGIPAAGIAQGPPHSPDSSMQEEATASRPRSAPPGLPLQRRRREHPALVLCAVIKFAPPHHDRARTDAFQGADALAREIGSRLSTPGPANRCCLFRGAATLHAPPRRGRFRRDSKSQENCLGRASNSERSTLRRTTIFRPSSARQNGRRHGCRDARIRALKIGLVRRDIRRCARRPTFPLAEADSSRQSVLLFSVNVRAGAHELCELDSVSRRSPLREPCRPADPRARLRCTFILERVFSCEVYRRRRWCMPRGSSGARSPPWWRGCFKR